MELKSVKIVNKSKEGVTIKVNPAAPVTKISWDEFKKNFKMTDNFTAEPTPEYLAELTELDDALTDAATSTMLMRAADKGEHGEKFLTYAAMAGSGVDRVQKAANCTMIEAMNLIRHRLMQIDNALSKPAGHHFAPRRIEHIDPTPKSGKTSMHSGNKSTELPSHSSAVMEDNPALLALKEKMAANA